MNRNAFLKITFWVSITKNLQKSSKTRTIFFQLINMQCLSSHMCWVAYQELLALNNYKFCLQSRGSKHAALWVRNKGKQFLWGDSWYLHSYESFLSCCLLGSSGFSVSIRPDLRWWASIHEIFFQICWISRCCHSCCSHCMCADCSQL